MLLSNKPIDIEQAVAILYAQKAMIVLVKGSYETKAISLAYSDTIHTFLHRHCTVTMTS